MNVKRRSGVAVLVLLLCVHAAVGLDRYTAAAMRDDLTLCADPDGLLRALSAGQSCEAPRREVDVVVASGTARDFWF